MSWFNSDGLLLKFGTEKTTANKGGEFHTVNGTHTVEFRLDLTALTETETIMSDVVNIPVGARFQEVEIITNTAAATGVAIDLGLIRQDRSTEIDYDGLLAAFPTASMDAAGEKNVISAGVTYGGAKLGTSLATYPAYVTCSRTTATAFTAGDIVVRIRWYVV